MKTLQFKSFEEFKDQLQTFDTVELATALFEAIQKGMKNGKEKVSVCDVEIEEDMEVFRLYSTKEDWPIALEGCMKAFIVAEEYEKCSEIQKLQRDYEIKKLVAEANKPKRGRKPKIKETN